MSCPPVRDPAGERVCPVSQGLGEPHVWTRSWPSATGGVACGYMPSIAIQHPDGPTDRHARLVLRAPRSKCVRVAPVASLDALLQHMVFSATLYSPS